MKKTTIKATPPPALHLEKGQLWRCAGNDIQVVHVGRYLVEHKIFKEGAGTGRARSLFAAITAFNETLNNNQARLVENQKAAK